MLQFWELRLIYDIDYVWHSNKPNPAQITGKMNGLEGGGRACESCYSKLSTKIGG